jgi:hypothetical protein
VLAFRPCRKNHAGKIVTVKPRYGRLTLSNPHIIARAYEGSGCWAEKNRHMAGLLGENLCYTEARKSSSPQNPRILLPTGVKKSKQPHA